MENLQTTWDKGMEVTAKPSTSLQMLPGLDCPEVTRHNMYKSDNKSFYLVSFVKLYSPSAGTYPSAGWIWYHSELPVNNNLLTRQVMSCWHSGKSLRCAVILNFESLTLLVVRDNPFLRMFCIFLPICPNVPSGVLIRAIVWVGGWDNCSHLLSCTFSDW